MVTLVALSALACATPSLAQYDIARARVAGGGTTSTGGGFALTGTVGQSDAGAMTGGTYAIAGGFWYGGTGVVGIGEDPAPALAFALHRALPNPALGSTVLGFDLPRACTAHMVVYDAAGRAVRTLVHGVLPAGQYRQAWDGNRDSGRTAGAGVYFVRLEAEEFSARQRIVLLR
jgi:hypothetical protein